MARINTNVAALTAQRGLTRTTLQLNDTLERLSTGLQINRGADDPAGLIASEGLRSEISGITQGIDNSQRASNVIATAEGALSEVASLLLNIKSLVVEGANTGALSRDEIEANQLQIDSAIESITRISNTTTFAGLKLLDGSLDYITSGVSTSAITALQITQANFYDNPDIPVEINVVTSALQAQVQFRSSALTGPLVLEVTGVEGTDSVNFASNASVSAVFTAVNRLSDQTGVRAEWLNASNAGSGIALVSSGYGSRSFVSVSALSGSISTVDSSGNAANRAVGRDAVATINGSLTVGEGLDISLNTTSLDINLTLDESFGAGATAFAIKGGGALFQLGPKVTGNQQVNIGLQSVAATKLGDGVVGFLNDIVTGGGKSLVENEADQASQVIELAIRQVSVLRGRLGAFERNTLDTNVNSLNVALENVTASESNIRDADFARETAALTRAQILQQAGTSVLSTANQQPQTVLRLLQ
jgi:flagellin